MLMRNTSHLGEQGGNVSPGPKSRVPQRNFVAALLSCVLQPTQPHVCERSHGAPRGCRECAGVHAVVGEDCDGVSSAVARTRRNHASPRCSGRAVIRWRAAARGGAWRDLSSLVCQNFLCRRRIEQLAHRARRVAARCLLLLLQPDCPTSSCRLLNSARRLPSPAWLRLKPRRPLRGRLLTRCVTAAASARRRPWFESRRRSDEDEEPQADARSSAAPRRSPSRATTTARGATAAAGLFSARLQNCVSEPRASTATAFAIATRRAAAPVGSRVRSPQAVQRAPARGGAGPSGVRRAAALLPGACAARRAPPAALQLTRAPPPPTWSPASFSSAHRSGALRRE